MSCSCEARQLSENFKTHSPSCEAAQQRSDLANARAARDLLAGQVRHVLRYGKLGKQSKARLKAALKASGG